MNINQPSLFHELQNSIEELREVKEELHMQLLDEEEEK